MKFIQIVNKAEQVRVLLRPFFQILLQEVKFTLNKFNVGTQEDVRLVVGFQILKYLS